MTAEALVAAFLLHWPWLIFGILVGGALDHYLLPVIVRVDVRLLRLFGRHRDGG